MTLAPRSLLKATTWGLLVLWLLFGSLELAEAVHLLPEIADEAPAGDLDEDALLQLASGLKPDVPSVSPRVGSVFSSLALVFFALTFSSSSASLWTRRERFLLSWSVRLHQRQSVYRI